MYVLGAPEALAPQLPGPALDEEVTARTAQGLRVLVVACAVDPHAPLRDSSGRPRLPALEPVALVALADELRPGVVETVARFAADGVGLKVVSGDDPRTVAALARQAGLDGGEPVTGAQLDGLSDAELDRVVARTTVFGRIAPEQKERLVDSLRRQGRYVAMIGDGVNDARALKRAQVGVAMRSGSGVTRDVADIVLTDDSLSALLPAQHEGRRIIDGIGTSMQVFLVRVGAQGLVIAAVTMLGLGFPYSPAQVGLTLLTVGVPTLFLTAWARPTPPNPHLLADIGRFVLPAAVITAAARRRAVRLALHVPARRLQPRRRARRRRRGVRGLHRPLRRTTPVSTRPWPRSAPRPRCRPSSPTPPSSSSSSSSRRTGSSRRGRARTADRRPAIARRRARRRVQRRPVPPVVHRLLRPDRRREAGVPDGAAGARSSGSPC